LGKKCNFNEIFSRRKKGTLQPKKGHLPKLPPPGSYAPDYASKESSTQIIFVFYWQYIKIPIRNRRNPRNVLSNFLWSFLSGAPKVRGPPVTGHPDTLPLRHW
jgi:hypothetical protein